MWRSHQTCGSLLPLLDEDSKSMPLDQHLRIGSDVAQDNKVCFFCLKSWKPDCLLVLDDHK